MPTPRPIPSADIAPGELPKPPEGNGDLCFNRAAGDWPSKAGEKPNEPPGVIPARFLGVVMAGNEATVEAGGGERDTGR